MKITLLPTIVFTLTLILILGVTQALIWRFEAIEHRLDLQEEMLNAHVRNLHVGAQGGGELLITIPRVRVLESPQPETRPARAESF